MIEPAAFFEVLRRHELTFFTGVPDSLLKDLCGYIGDHVPPKDHIINANEGSAVALAAGYHLATGRIPVVYLQNSGLGNALNPLLSLADPAVYAIPILFIIGWRGEPGVKDEPQHVAQGRVMVPLLESIGLAHDIVDASTTDLDRLVGAAVERMRVTGAPHAFLIRKTTFAPYAAAQAAPSDASLTRGDAIDLVLRFLGRNDLLVSTTGMTSREVFAHRKEHGGGHERDFLTVGSMGHSSQIALGIAHRVPSRRVVCLDGDGALIMHMGSLAIVGTQRPTNFAHIVINNGAHDSVGGQPTAARHIDIPAVAQACGYRAAWTATTATDVEVGVQRLLVEPGPSLLEVRVASRASTDAGRPDATPRANKRAFMEAIQGDSQG